VDIMNIATNLVQGQLDSGTDSTNIQESLGALFGGSDGGFDIGSIVSNMSENGGLSSIVSSWLGDGENEGIDTDTVSQLFDSEKLGTFASSLGIDMESATALLSNVLPGIVDQASSGGNLLESVGGLDGALSFAKKFF